MNRKRIAGAVIAASFTFGANAVYAQDMQLVGANVFPATVKQAGVALEEFAKKLEERTGGAVKSRLVHGGALLDPTNQITGLGSGVADYAYLFPSYFPGDFKVEGRLSNIADLWHPGIDVRDTVQIHQKLIEQFPQFLDEYESRGIRVLFPTPATPFPIACRTPVMSLAELEGKKIRAFGQYWPRLIEEGLKARAVSMPANELYSALATGTVDCTIGTVDFYLSGKIFEIAPNLVFTGPERSAVQALATGVVAMNKAKYESLPANIKTAVDEVAKEMGPFMAEQMASLYEDSVKEFLTHGGKSWNMSKEDVETVKGRMPNLFEVAGADLEAAGYPGKEIVAAYAKLAAELGGN